MSQEARSAYESLKFIALDMLKPSSSSASSSSSVATLREAVKNFGAGGCQLLYDLIRRPAEVANVERALSLAVGNVAVCPDRQTASQLVNQVARESGSSGGRVKCSAISLQCNTFYKNPVEIVAHFGGGGSARNGASSGSPPVDEEEYHAEETRLARLEKQLATAQQALIQATTALEPLTATVLR